MVFFVRTAAEGDVEKIRDLLKETFHATYDPFYGPEKVTQLVNSWHSPAAIRARIVRKDGEFLVADNGTELAGLGYAAMYPKMEKTVMLHQLYVRPSCQGEGVGRDIFAELETCFPYAEVMRTEVALENERAISFYQRLGFSEVDRMEEWGGPNSGLPAVVLEKPLRNL